jgi:predicted RNase H-like HicB family nuclease
LPGTDSDRILRSEERMKLQIVLEPSDEGGFTVTVPALPGCISEGNTREEALRNIEEAIRLYLEPLDGTQEYGPNAEVLEIAM